MDQPPPPPSAAKPPSSSKVLFVVIALLVAVNLGGTVFVVLKVLHPPVASAEPAHAEPPAPTVGPTVQMETFVVNLNEPGSARYLKTSFEIEVSTPAIANELTTMKNLVRDDLIRYFSGLTVAATLGEENKTKIKAEVVSRVEKLVGPNKVHRIFLTEFVVQ
jgi:flagellar FliL protein